MAATVSAMLMLPNLYGCCNNRYCFFILLLLLCLPLRPSLGLLYTRSGFIHCMQFIKILRIRTHVR